MQSSTVNVFVKSTYTTHSLIEKTRQRRSTKITSPCSPHEITVM